MKVKHIAFITVLILSQFVFSQDETSITIEFNNLTRQEAIQKIESKTTYFFYYQENWFDNSKITKSYQNVLFKDLLNDLLKNTSINFSVFDKKVVLTNNTIIQKGLPIGYFIIDKKSEKKNDSESPIVLKDYIANQNSQKDNIITIGKENNNATSKQFTISGYVKNHNTGAEIKGVRVFIKGEEKKTFTDANGYYSITAPGGFNVINAEVDGQQNIQQNIVVYGNGTLSFDMFDDVVELDEVVILTDIDENIRKPAIGLTKVDVKGVKRIPMVLGERDILKIATTMPGVKTAGEGSLGYNVRGGKSDQNLILLDNAVIYNPSHFFGVFTAINPYSTGSAEIYKGSIPAEYGGRLSSVIDISTKKLKNTEFSGQGNIGPVTANLMLETPITKDKTGVLIGFRSTYSDWLLKQVNNDAVRNSQASFYDGIFRFDSKLNKKNKLKSTLYYSNDKFSISSDSIYKYNNRLASLEWNHDFSKKHKSSLELNNSNYRFNIIYDGVFNNNFDFDFSIDETQAKLKFDYLHSSNHKFTYGISSKLYRIAPGRLLPLGNESIVEPTILDTEKGIESAVFVSDKIQINDKLLFDLGFRYSVFSSIGEGFQNIYEEGLPLSTETIVETRHYKNNEIIKTYSAPEIRASARFFVTPTLSIKGGYNKTVQYLHMLSKNTTASPVDSWKLSDLNIKPQKSDQISLGLFKNLSSNDYEISLETYYKKMDNIIDFKVGADLSLNKHIETVVLDGVGKAYGVEFLLRKKQGNFNGWIGYSYSRSFLKLNSDFITNQVNNGDFFPSNYDKPHDLSLVTNYKLTRRYSFSFNFIYQTGRPITYPIGNYEYGGIEHVLYSDRNQFRIPDYYRFDLGINIEGNHKIKKLAHSFWNISVYNVLGRNNPYSIYFVNNEGEIKAYKTSIFAVPIPTITYNFKF